MIKHPGHRGRQGYLLYNSKPHSNIEGTPRQKSEGRPVFHTGSPLATDLMSQPKNHDRSLRATAFWLAGRNMLNQLSSIVWDHQVENKATHSELGPYTSMNSQGNLL